MDRLPPLAEVPLAALDAAFEARVRAAPRPEQDRMLAEADLLRVSEDDASSWRALTVYRALVERLEEGGAQQLDRAAWTAHESPARDAVQRRIATLALAHPGEEEQGRAVLTLAACEWAAGEFVASERRLRALLPSVRGRGDALELGVYYALACLYAWQRREFEALVLARRALGVAEGRGDLHPVHAAHALSALADAYRSLEDEGGLTTAAQRMLAASTRMSEPDAGRLRRQAYVIAHEAALLRDALLEAREQLDAAASEHARDLKTAGHHDTVLDYHEARLALRRGLPAHAGPLLERNRTRDAAHPTLDLLWDMLAVDHARQTGQRAALLERAKAVLGRLQDPRQRVQIGSGRRLTNAQRLGEMLQDTPGATELATLAWREAADAAFLRLEELARAQHDLPELERPTPADHEALARYRSRFVARHRLLLEHLRELLVAARTRGELPSWARTAPGGLVAVCAWCRSVRDTDGRWLPLGHFIATSGPHLTITHGICETCRPAIQG